MQTHQWREHSIRSAFSFFHTHQQGKPVFSSHSSSFMNLMNILNEHLISPEGEKVFQSQGGLYLGLSKCFETGIMRQRSRTNDGMGMIDKLSEIGI